MFSAFCHIQISVKLPRKTKNAFFATFCAENDDKSRSYTVFTRTTYKDWLMCLIRHDCVCLSFRLSSCSSSVALSVAVVKHTHSRTHTDREMNLAQVNLVSVPLSTTTKTTTRTLVRGRGPRRSLRCRRCSCRAPQRVDGRSPAVRTTALWISVVQGCGCGRVRLLHAVDVTQHRCVHVSQNTPYPPFFFL